MTSQSGRAARINDGGRCFCFCFGVASFCRTELARCSHFEAGRHGTGPMNDRGSVIFSARSARRVRQLAYATCPTKQDASAPNTVADTRCVTGVRRRGRPRFPVGEISRHSNGEPARSIRCIGRTPRDRDRTARRIGETKDACETALAQPLAALRQSPKT